MNSAFRTKKPGSIVMPDRNTEYLYYQTLIGAWPLPMDRAQAYMLKAVREAKQQTSWVANNKEFEEACLRLALKMAKAIKGKDQLTQVGRDHDVWATCYETLNAYRAAGWRD